jgi:hypothetical protein
MPAMAAPGKANISNHANHPAARNERAEAMTPDLVQFVVKSLVVFDETELAGVLGIFLEGPVGRGGDNKVDGIVGYPIKMARIPAMNYMG